MSIKYAILGILSWKPSTGYEMKKIFEDSSILYWSGNNNQIYKTLLQLLDEGLAVGETKHQEASPSKKVYTITNDGLAELKKWVLSTPEAPEFRKSFLIQLAWADMLSDKELDQLLLKYENEIKIQLLINREINRRSANVPMRTPREALLWDMISDNLMSSLKNELDWVQESRKKLLGNETLPQKERIDYRLIKKEEDSFVEIAAAQPPLATEEDALELVALCGEKAVNLLLIHNNVLDRGFFRYNTGIAGKILQKFSNYNIKAAVVIPLEIMEKDMNLGANRQISKAHNFRVFETVEEAEKWLLG